MAARYLVTGCAGFIGARVAEMLLDAGHEVVGWDNINDAYDRQLKLWRLARLKECERFTFEYHDVADREAVERGFESHAHADVGMAPRPKRRAPFDAVVHLAARAGVRTSVENPWVYVETNVTGTLNLLEACRRSGVKKFVLASTSSLYGGHNSTPYREDADVSRPLSPYAATKLAAEGLAYSYHHLHGLDVSVPRFFTVYGPAGRPDMSVFRFVRNIAEGVPITLFGDGEQQRDFTYIDDIARGVIAALRPVGFEVINLGNDEPASVNRLIEQIASLVGRAPIIERKAAHPADVPKTWADITKARAVLEWSPQTTLADGLRQSVQWYRQHRETIVHVELELGTPNPSAPPPKGRRAA